MSACPNGLEAGGPEGAVGPERDDDANSEARTSGAASAPLRLPFGTEVGAVGEGKGLDDEGEAW